MLSALIQSRLSEKRWSANQLAMASGNAQSTISVLLNPGDENGDMVSVHPKVLKSVCSTLKIDYLKAYQEAGFIPADYQPALDSEPELIRKCKQVPDDKKATLLEIIDLFLEDDLLSGAELKQLIQRIKQLRVQHQFLLERRFQLKEHAGYLISRVTGVDTPELLAASIVQRLREILSDNATKNLSEETLTNIVDHPYNRIVLNILVPRKNLSTSLHKLYWLTYPAEASQAKARDVIAKQQSVAVTAIWELLQEVFATL